MEALCSSFNNSRIRISLKHIVFGCSTFSSKASSYPTSTSLWPPATRSLLRHLQLLRVDRSHRKLSKTALVIGPKLISELCQPPIKAKTLLLSPSYSLPDSNRKSNNDAREAAKLDLNQMYCDKVYEASESDMAKIAGVDSLVGYHACVAEVPLPNWPDFLSISSDEFLSSVQQHRKSVQSASSSSPSSINNLRILIMDTITDPGNCGTILRSAFAFGYDVALLTAGCTDPFNEKVIRASGGSVFHMPNCVLPQSEAEMCSSIASFIERHNLVPFVAEARPNSLDIAKDIKQIEKHMKDNQSKNGVSGSILVLGSESHGVSRALAEALGPKKQSICVGMPQQKAESLNVAIAGSISMHALSNIC